MTSGRDPFDRLAWFRPLIDHASREGWTVLLSPAGLLIFMKPGLPVIHAGKSGAISDKRSRGDVHG
jgi:hypothetical protein